MLRVIALSERLRLPIPQFGHSNAPFNVVPVDFVLDALIAGAGAPSAAGETLHLVDPEPVTAAQMMGILGETNAGRSPSVNLPPATITALLRLPAAPAQIRDPPREAIR